MASQDRKPQVTVVCITYGHEDFISQALDSILMQETSFDFQVFVGEDCGPDNTAAIVKDYAERYPDRVVPFLREENMGAQRNLIDMCQRAGTPYIAFCEGDDYWTDPKKLQKQYDLMEQNPELSACFHNTEIQSDDDWYLRGYYIPDSAGRHLIPASIPKYDESIRVMAMGYYIRFGPAHTSSMFFRWNYELTIPEWYYQTIFGDHPIMMMQVGDGLVGFLPDVMSVYRRHAGGIIMNDSGRKHHLHTREDWLVVLEGLEANFQERFGDYCATEIRARMVTEMRNYLVHAVGLERWDAITEVIRRHPLPFSLYVDEDARLSQIRNRMVTRVYGSNPAGLAADSHRDAGSLLPRLALSKRRESRERNRAADFHAYSKVQKKRGLWLFMCDDKWTYRDNVRCFYEYIVENHPEIEAWWLTKSQSIRQLLTSEGLPVTMLKTANSRSLLTRAEALFCQSLRDDIFEMRGFNAGLRVVRLIDNPYFEQVRLFSRRRASETHTVDDLEAAMDDSPRSWRHRSNLVVSDSDAVVELIRKAGDSQTVAKIATEPRLLSIPEPLLPLNSRHVLVMPGLMSTETAKSLLRWLLEDSAELDDFCTRSRVALQILLPTSSRYHELVKDQIAEYDNLHLLQTNDIYSVLGSLSGAVCGLTPVGIGAVRKGLPVAFCLAQDASAVHAGIPQSLPGTVTTDWFDAIRDVVGQLDSPHPRPSSEVARRYGMAERLDAGSMKQLFDTVSSWLTEEGRA